jgi:hypothetical protein
MTLTDKLKTGAIYATVAAALVGGKHLLNERDIVNVAQKTETFRVEVDRGLYQTHLEGMDELLSRFTKVTGPSDCDDPNFGIFPSLRQNDAVNIVDQEYGTLDTSFGPRQVLTSLLVTTDTNCRIIAPNQKGYFRLSFNSPEEAARLYEVNHANVLNADNLPIDLKGKKLTSYDIPTQGKVAHINLDPEASYTRTDNPNGSVTLTGPMLYILENQFEIAQSRHKQSIRQTDRVGAISGLGRVKYFGSDTRIGSITLK